MPRRPSPAARVRRLISRRRPRVAAAVAVALTVWTAPVAAADTWRWPVAGDVVAAFADAPDPYAAGQHRGIDVEAPTGTPVVAAVGGTVRFSGLVGSSGITVSTRTADGRFDVSYLHLAHAVVRAGQTLAAGDRIGAAGTTGSPSSTTPHLHLGVRDAGTRRYRDPLDFLPPTPRVRDLPRGAPVPVRRPVRVGPAPQPVRSHRFPVAARQPAPAAAPPRTGWAIACGALILAAVLLGTRSSIGTVSYYVTTPIYYVNGEPHLGHVYTTIAADVLARHMRQRGEDVFFLTGTDEHGEPVAQAAEREGIAPRELADRNAERFKEVARRVEATNDFFIRTSDPRARGGRSGNREPAEGERPRLRGPLRGLVLPALRRLQDRERDRSRATRCPIHLIELDREQEENWFFRLSAFQEPLEQLYAERPDLVLPREPLQRGAVVHPGRAQRRLAHPRTADLGRAGPVGSRPGRSTSGSTRCSTTTRRCRYARPGEDLTERFWPPTVHLIAKDILKFHAVYLAGAADGGRASSMPKQLFVHGYLLMDDHKMSKSLGNVLDPFEVIDVYGTDALRYYLLREVGFGQDGSISPEGFETRYDAELANEYGNLASRTLAMIAKYRDGVVPDADPAPEIATQFDGPRRTRPRADRPRRGQRGARGRSGSGCARSTATSRRASRGSSPRTRRRPVELDAVLYTSPRDCASSRCCCAPWMPDDDRAAARGARPAEDRRSRRRELGRRRRRGDARRARAAVPAHRASGRGTGVSRAWSTRTATSTRASRRTPSWSPTRARSASRGSRRSA